MRELVVIFIAGLWALPQAQCASSWEQRAIEVQQGSGYLGVGLLDVDEVRARELHLPEARGAEVSRVESGSPADKAGIRPGDVVLEFNGQALESITQLGRLVRETPPGKHARLKLWREGKILTLGVTIEARKPPLVGSTGPDLTITVPLPAWEFPEPILGWRSGAIGIECEPLTPQLAEFFGVKNGLLVRAVAHDAPAERAGLKAGDVLTRVGDKNINSPFDLGAALRNHKDRPVVLSLTRDRKEITLKVMPEDLLSPRLTGSKDVVAQQ